MLTDKSNKKSECLISRHRAHKLQLQCRLSSCATFGGRNVVVAFEVLNLSGRPILDSCLSYLGQSSGLHHQPSRQEFGPPQGNLPFRVPMPVSPRAQQTGQERIRDIGSQELVLEVTLQHSPGTSDHCDCWLALLIR